MFFIFPGVKYKIELLLKIMRQQHNPVLLELPQADQDIRPLRTYVYRVTSHHHLETKQLKNIFQKIHTDYRFTDLDG